MHKWLNGENVCVCGVCAFSAKEIEKLFLLSSHISLLHPSIFFCGSYIKIMVYARKKILLINLMHLEL